MIKTKDDRLIDADELVWEEARLMIQPFLPELVEIIDELAPSADYKLYKARYPFGAKIIDKTEAYLPLNDGRMISFNDSNLPQTLINNLSYDSKTSNPVGIVLNKSSEFYLSIGNRIMPYMIVSPGEIFGLTRILDKTDMSSLPLPHVSFFIWELTSGARSSFMLPKITESLSHNKLKKAYNLTQDKPTSYQDHWDIFRNIAQIRKADWHSEFLFFSNKWFERLTDPSWLKLYCYFLRNNRQSYEFWRNILSWQITFNEIEQTKNLKFSSYTLDTAKHLFAIAAGVLPGFKPSTDESAIPVKTLQQAYVDGYGLNDYWPVIMEPALFSLSTKQPVYYSLSYPTLAQYDATALKGKSIISLLDELEFVIDKYLTGIKDNPLATSTSLDKTAMMIDFNYYHHDPASYNNIKDSSLIPNEDNRFVLQNHNGGEFPKHSSFLKGCVKLGPKHNI